MTEYPWNILGIEPTADELAIRRAYARKLKQFRPDEDPEGFANLVRAREHALQWRVLHERDDLPVTKSEADEAPANESEATAPQPGTNDAQSFSNEDFSSKEFGTAAAPVEPDQFDARAQAAAFMATTNRLSELVRGAETAFAVPVWEASWTTNQSWENAVRLWDAGEWRSILSGLREFNFGQRQALRDFVVREVLPRLRPPPGGGTVIKDLLEDQGPGAVVNIWETEFGIRHDQGALAQLCGTQAMLRYLDWLALAERKLPAHKRTDAERHFVDLLDKVLPPRDTKAGSAANVAWAPDPWTELFALVRQMGLAEATRCRDLFAERLTAWLPKLPSGPLAKLGAEAAPATIVGEIEREFSLSERLDSPFIEPEGAARYQDWLAYAHRMRAIAERCAKGPPAYRDEAGIPLIPPEDIAFGVLPGKNLEALAQAQRDGRWRHKLSLLAFAAPAMTLAVNGLRWSGAGLAAIEIASLFGLQLPSYGVQLPFVTPYQVAIIAAVFLTVHLALALAMQRLTVMAAVRRVKRADRLGLINSGERQSAIAWKITPISGAILIAAAIFPIGLFGTWAGAKYRTEELQNPPGSSGRWILTGEQQARANNFSGAISAFTSAIEKDPDAVRAYRGRGDAFLAAGNPHRAIDDYNRVVSLNPKDVEMRLKRVRAYLTLNRGDLAAPDYTAVIELDPDQGRQRLLSTWNSAVSAYLTRPLTANLTAKVTTWLSNRSPSSNGNSSVSRVDPEALSKLEHLDLPKKSLIYQADREYIPKVAVTFSVDRNGHLLAKVIDISSLDRDFDAAALLLLDKSDPLPPPPPPAAGAQEQWNFATTIAFHATPKTSASD